MYIEGGEFEKLEKIKEKIIETLQAEYARGTLNLDEFERLLSRTQDISTSKELEILAEELPDLSRKPERAIDYSIRNHDDYLKSGETDDTFVTVLGDRHVRGVWYPKPSSKVFSFMGDVTLDFSQAVLPGPVTEVTVFCMLSDVKVKVPPGVEVAMNGVPLLGSFEDKTTHREGRSRMHEGRRIIKINGVAILASVKAKEV